MPTGKPRKVESLKLVRDMEKLVMEVPVMEIFTPVLFNVGTKGLMLNTIFPSELVHVAGDGFGVMETVAQLPPTIPEHRGSVEGITVTVFDDVALQPPLIALYWIVNTPTPATEGLKLFPVIPAPVNVPPRVAGNSVTALDEVQ